MSKCYIWIKIHTRPKQIWKSDFCLLISRCEIKHWKPGGDFLWLKTGYACESLPCLEKAIKMHVREKGTGNWYNTKLIWILIWFWLANNVGLVPGILIGASNSVQVVSAEKHQSYQAGVWARFWKAETFHYVSLPWFPTCFPSLVSPWNFEDFEQANLQEIGLKRPLLQKWDLSAVIGPTQENCSQKSMTHKDHDIKMTFMNAKAKRFLEILEEIRSLWSLPEEDYFQPEANFTISELIVDNDFLSSRWLVYKE